MCVGKLLRQPFINTYDEKYFKKPHDIPSQKTVYKKFFNKNLEETHDAKNDTIATIEVVKYTVANPIIKKNNVKPEEKCSDYNDNKNQLSNDCV